MPDLLRVKQTDTGHELTVTQSMYDFAPDAYDVLKDKPATDGGGNPLPPKYKTTVAKSASAKRAAAPQSPEPDHGHEADTQKETS